MGWDAHAVLSNGDRIERRYEDLRLQIVDPKIREIFRVACERVLAKAGKIDWAIRAGGLGYRSCGYFIQEATGTSCYGGDWSTEDVRVMAENPGWDAIQVDPDLAWAYWSARVFVETCAEHGFGIYNSF